MENVRVSIRPLLEDEQKRRELRRHELPADSPIATVELSPGGLKVPAAVTMRTMVCLPRSGETGVRWEVIIGPQTMGLLKRLLSLPRKSLAEISVTDVPDVLDVNYEMTRRLLPGHRALSDLQPHPPGTFVEMTFAVQHDLVRVAGITLSSSTEMLRRRRGLVMHRNKQAQLAYRALCWPLWGPLSVFGWRVWPSRDIHEPVLIDVPSIPRGEDPWEQDGAHWRKLCQIVADHFAQPLESLWKAVFVNDPFVKSQLEQAGYALDRLEQTQLGSDALAELIRNCRDAGRLTMLAPPDLNLDEL